MADSNNETGTSEASDTESSGQSACSPPSLFSNMSSLILSEEPRELSSISSDASYVASGEQDGLATEERLLKRRRVEEPETEHQQRSMAWDDNNELHDLVPESTDMASFAAAAAAVEEREQTETEKEEILLERWQFKERGVENTASTSHPEQFNADCNLLADLFCIDDQGSSFRPLIAEFSTSSSSSSHLAPPTAKKIPL